MHLTISAGSGLRREVDVGHHALGAVERDQPEAHPAAGLADLLGVEAADVETAIRQVAGHPGRHRGLAGAGLAREQDAGN